MIPEVNSPSFASDAENHPLRLNSSSITSPSDSHFNSDGKRNFVPFEEYHHNCQPKKKLTIVIDESYGFEEDNVSVQSKVDPLAFHKSGQKFHEQASTPLSELGLLSPVENNQRILSCDYGELLERLKKSEEKNLQYQIEMESLRKEVKEQRQKMQANSSVWQASLKKKDDTIEMNQQYIDELILQLNSYKEKFEENKYYDEKMREKQIEIMKLSKVTDRLKSINKELNKQLKMNERKVRDLEGEVQKSVYHATLNNLNKMKESSLKVQNKENSVTNGPRKSLERKKSGNQVKKTQRIASSSSTLLTKKLMPK